MASTCAGTSFLYGFLAAAFSSNQLSRAKLGVADLVSPDLTNREIAERWSSRMRTAEGHVQPIRNTPSFTSSEQMTGCVVAQNGELSRNQ